MTKVIRSGLDLPSTNNVKSYPKNLLPNHTLFKIISHEIVNFDYDKELSTQFIIKPVINSDGVMWLQSEKAFTNYLQDELPWELKIGMSKIYRNMIMGNDKSTDGDKSWDPTGWYMYVNPFLNRNEKMNMYKGHVSLSYSFLSPETDIKNILERKLDFEPFNDLNEQHLCHIMNYVNGEYDKFLMNNYNAVNLYNYRQVEEINAASKYKAARGKRIGNRELKPYSPGKKGKIANSKESNLGKKRSKSQLQKMVSRRIIDDEDDMEMILNKEITKKDYEDDD